MEIGIQSWSNFKDIVNSNGLFYRYYDQGANYLVWASDGPVIYTYTIWKAGFEPIFQDNKSQVSRPFTNQIALDRLDFEQNILPIANLKVQPLTYAACITALSPATSATDIFEIDGSATKDVQIVQIGISGTVTTAATVDVQVIKRHSLNSGGTFTQPMIVPYLPKIPTVKRPFLTKTIDQTAISGFNSMPTALSQNFGDSRPFYVPNNPTTVIKAYTANPILGAAVGNLMVIKLGLATTIQPQSVALVNQQPSSQPITLFGINESLCINFNGANLTGASIDIFIVWNER